MKINAKVILLAEDDPDDSYLIGEAIDESQVAARLFVVQDGEELLDYLYRRGQYADEEAWPRPNLILLDLNMPRKSGREALAEIKADESLNQIPVVVLTTSKADEDLASSYASGASGFVSKPVSFHELRELMRNLGQYWFVTVKLPDQANPAGPLPAE
jgi:CheY-like chemotaxis protein